MMLNVEIMTTPIRKTEFECSLATHVPLQPYQLQPYRNGHEANGIFPNAHHILIKSPELHQQLSILSIHNVFRRALYGSSSSIQVGSFSRRFSS